MTRATPYQLLLINLEQSLPKNALGYTSKESAYEGLKRLSGEDFGDDVAAWKKWLKDHKLL
ncbi:MAG: hypothetical protein KF716_01440 [Anaerolineae bacterium]|nr:hypothetical protein [Anaerolineae bacterium]